MPRYNKALWKYFEPNDNKIGECKICNKELSYKSTTHNLLIHLKLKHADYYKEFSERNHAQNKRRLPSMPKSCNLLIWNYFQQHPDKIADCKQCSKKLSYKTTIANLKQHLKLVHPDNFNEFLEQADSVAADSSEDLTECESDDGAEKLQKVTDVWRYFDTDSSKKAQCVVCKASVGKEYEELKAHLRDSHPNLLLEILQDQNSDEGSIEAQDDNTYTEIVYLEQEPQTEPVKKHKEKTISYPKLLKKRDRHNSRHSTEDLPLKKAKLEEDNDELTTFVKYITCLLKKLPAEAFSDVQIEIINTILKAKAQANAANTSQSMVFNKELVNTRTSSSIITVDGLQPIPSTMMGHHNYTITVGTTKESEVEDNS